MEKYNLNEKNINFFSVFPLVFLVSLAIENSYPCHYSADVIIIVITFWMDFKEKSSTLNQIITIQLMSYNWIDRFEKASPLLRGFQYNCNKYSLPSSMIQEKPLWKFERISRFMIAFGFSNIYQGTKARWTRFVNLFFHIFTVQIFLRLKYI